MLLAYKYVFAAAMLSWVNEYAPRMHLPMTVPVQQGDIRFLYVSKPVVLDNYQHYGGRLQVTNYAFIFDLYSRTIHNLDEFGFVKFGVPMGEHESGASGMERASREKYVVSTNDTYRMASNWIAALDIDLEKLESVNPLSVNPNPLFKSDRGWVPNPIMEVRWNNPKFPGHHPTGISVEISAVTGELLKLWEGEDTSHKQKRPLLYDPAKLIAIPDEEFLTYTAQQRADLVEKFAGIKGDKDFLTNIPAAFNGKFSTLKPKPSGLRDRSTN